MWLWQMEKKVRLHNRGKYIFVSDCWSLLLRVDRPEMEPRVNEALMLLAFVGVMEWGMGFITGALPFLLFGMLLFRFRVMGPGTAS